ncbi:MAG: hypothetical protein QW279_14005, partial [Candidatus Jordarchaeaceae archaeon]
ISQGWVRLVEDVEKFLAEKSKEPTQLAQEVNAKITESLKQYIVETDAKIAEIKQATEDIVNRDITEFQENIANLQCAIDGSFSGKMELIKKTGDEIESELSSRIGFILDENQKSLSNLKGIVEQDIKGNLEYLEGEIDKLKSKFSSDMSDRLETRKMENEKLVGSIYEKIGVEKQALESIGSSLFDDASSMLVGHINSTKETINEGRGLLLENVSELIKTIRESKEQTIQNILENTQSELENYKNKMEGINEEIESLMKKQQEKVASDTETVKVKTGETIQKIVEENNSILDSARKESEELFKNNSVNIKEMLKVTGASLTGTIESYIKESEEQAKALKSSLVESLGNYVEELQGTILNSKEESSQLIKSQLEDYNKTISEAKETMVETITEHSQVLRETIGEVQNKFSESLIKHENDINGAVEKIHEKISSNLENIENNITTCISETSSKVTKLFEETEKDSSATIEILAAAWKELEKTKLKEVKKTWYLVTKESIMTHIIDMIRRASRTITIIIPNIQDIPIKEITAKEEPVIVHLITDFSEEQKKDITKLLKKKVRIWKRSEGDLYGCIMDQKEVLLAPSITDEIPVALVSEEEGYAKIYQKILLPYLVVKAEEIRV